MSEHARRPAAIGIAVVLCACQAADTAPASKPTRLHLGPSSERPGALGDDPFVQARDVTGRSVKTRRVRAIHADDDALVGSTGWLLRHDPWLAYARGRELTLREFSATDGAYGEAGKLDGKTLDDGSTKMMSRDHTNSCAMCHNVPWRDAGAGATIAKNGGAGRNTPHAFGGGLIEMIGWQTRLRLLALGDADRNGFVGTHESEGVRAVLDEGGHRIDFGTFGDADGDGRPDLNPVIYVWYVDVQGKRIPWARSLRDAGVAGYDFEVQVFGHGQRDRFGHGGISSTLRSFTANAFDIHSGLTPCDPFLNDEPAADGLALVSLCGAQQFFTGRTRDRGLVLDVFGRSLDDPDRDGVIEEITAGDLDLVEWYLLNHPRPATTAAAMAGTSGTAGTAGTAETRGRAVFEALRCDRCHVPDWRIDARHEDPDYTARRLGDRRFFDLEVTFQDGEPRGRIVPVLAGAAFVVRGVYSDFLQHDLGPRFEEIQFDGSRTTNFRTSPLWGVGSTAPYGHDGASLDLDTVIRRHGGEATAEHDAYVAASREDRAALLDFLRGLVLFATDTLPTDVDGDGAIAEHFVVSGVDTGRERFNPEWLFRVPGRIEGWTVNATREPVFSCALTNLREAYGVDLPGLADIDRDGWPDCVTARDSGKPEPAAARRNP